MFKDREGERETDNVFEHGDSCSYLFVKCLSKFGVQRKAGMILLLKSESKCHSYYALLKFDCVGFFGFVFACLAVRVFACLLICKSMFIRILNRFQYI
jgi:hypothetical protein